jgi:hypothetical protein
MAHIAKKSGNGIQGAFASTGRRQRKQDRHKHPMVVQRSNKSEELPRLPVADRISSCLSCKRPKKGEYSRQEGPRREYPGWFGIHLENLG